MRCLPITRRCFVTIVMSGIALVPSARADWKIGDPFKMHFPQLPDLTPTGMDVLATRDPDPAANNNFKLLADDWLCTESGPVNDIHIWGSWLHDQLPNGDPNNVTFKLSVHANVPPPPTGGFSQPGPELWSTILGPGSFIPRLYGTGPEQFYDPNLHQIIGGDTQVWQYNFKNIANPFIQKAGEIYWLDVQTLTGDPNAFFGWKTTNPQDPRTPHFMDDAVFADTLGFADPLLPPGWTPMIYPVGHPFADASIDLAFVITPEPSSAAVLGIGMSVLALRRRHRSTH